MGRYLLAVMGKQKYHTKKTNLNSITLTGLSYSAKPDQGQKAFGARWVKDQKYKRLSSTLEKKTMGERVHNYLLQSDKTSKTPNSLSADEEAKYIAATT